MNNESSIQTCIGLSDSFPVFEANQILTSKHLNDLRFFLDTQDRLTRSRLIGLGILCGMEVENICENNDPAKLTGIKITKGVGVTSEGYIIETDLVALSQFQPYTDPAGYDLFWTASGKSKTQISILELLPDQCDNPTNPLSLNRTLIKDSPSTLLNKVIMVYVELYDKSQLSCFTDSCDGKGQNRILTIRYLLIDKHAVEKYLRQRYSISDNTTTEVFFNNKFTLPEVAIRSINLYNISDINNLNLKYQEAVAEVIPSLNNALKSAFNTYKRWLQGAILFKADLDKQLLQTALDNVENSQYFYDLISDLIQAYNEFKNEAFALNSSCCPSYDWFPMHLLLGLYDEPVSPIPSVFRNRFVPSPIFNMQSEKIKKCVMLWNRFSIMVSNFTVVKGDGIPIRITPSLLTHSSLSEKAIPFYYSPLSEINGNIHEFWNFNLIKQNRASYQLSYHADSYPYKSDLVINPLIYNNQYYNFLRIEGHQGKPLQTCIDKITEIQNTYNLPFSLYSICINDPIKDSDFNNDFNNSFKTGADDNNPNLKFAGFVRNHPGIEHVAGVQKGGTFILVYQECITSDGTKEATVLADFSLPYFIHSEKQSGDFDYDFNNSYDILK